MLSLVLCLFYTILYYNTSIFAICLKYAIFVLHYEVKIYEVCICN